jgi:hypothetical protein
MASVEKICADLEYLSGKISDLTRTISLSVLALVWLFIAGGANAPVLHTAPSHGLLLLSGLFVLLSLLSDYLQFVAGYANSKKVLGVAEASKDQQATYNPAAALYRLRSSLFWVKQLFAVASLVVLLVAVTAAVVCG